MPPAAPQPRRPVERLRYYVAGAFTVEHRPGDGVCADTAVVLLPPMGYEDTCAHRPLRVLADALAAEGFVVLQLEWPGLGDSVGDDASPDLGERWFAAIQAACGALRARGHTRVAGVGVRVGALLALAAPGFDQLVLWAMPTNGRAFLREERVFERMSAPVAGKPYAGPGPEPGTVEAAGFVYRAPTIAALEALDGTSLASARSGLERVLLIERDDAVPAPALLDALGTAGARVTVGPAAGLGDLLERPYKAALNDAVRGAILDWFAAGRVPGEHPRIHPGPTAELRLALPNGVTEHPWVARGEVGELSGIVCEPAGGARPGAAWTTFYNAGGMRRSGPNRLWTTAARALAAQGSPSLRFDVRDVGDSDGSDVAHRDLDGMYSEASIGDALLAWDWVHAQNAGNVDVVGLCSGAFLGMQVASRRAVRSALLFNGLAFVWNDEARASDMTSEVGRSLFDGRRWRRLLTGRIDAVELARSLALKGRVRGSATLARLRGHPPPDDVAELIRTVTGRGTHLHLVSSDGDPSIAYLQAHTTLKTRPKLTILPGVDHTIRPIWAHGHVVSLVTGMNPGAR